MLYHYRFEPIDLVHRCVHVSEARHSTTFKTFVNPQFAFNLLICNLFSDFQNCLETGMTYSGAHFTSTRKKMQRKKAPNFGAFIQAVENQAKTISSPSTFAVIAVPGRKRPARINCASGFSIQRWIARFSGRAP